MWEWDLFYNPSHTSIYANEKKVSNSHLTQSVVGTTTNPFSQRTYLPTEACAEHAAHDTIHWAINFAYTQYILH